MPSNLFERIRNKFNRRSRERQEKQQRELDEQVAIRNYEQQVAILRMEEENRLYEENRRAFENQILLGPQHGYQYPEQTYTIPTTGIYNITTQINNTEFTTGPIPIDAGYTYTITNINTPIPEQTMFVPRDTVPTGYNFNPQGYFNAIPFETY